MTPEQVAKLFHSECRHAEDSSRWCVTHESKWFGSEPGMDCEAMIDWVDLAEQAVEGYQADLRAEVVALRDEGKSGDDFDEGWSGACRRVLNLINRKPDA